MAIHRIPSSRFLKMGLKKADSHNILQLRETFEFTSEIKFKHHISCQSSVAGRSVSFPRTARSKARPPQTHHTYLFPKIPTRMLCWPLEVALNQKEVSIDLSFGPRHLEISTTGLASNLHAVQDWRTDFDRGSRLYKETASWEDFQRHLWINCHGGE